MKQIGFVKQEELLYKDKDGKETLKKWLECHFRVAGLRPFKAKMVKAKNPTNNKPNYYIYLRSNVNKGDKFRDIQIGALWVKTKQEAGKEVSYMVGEIEINFTSMPIVIWKAKPRFDGEELHYLYDIYKSTPRVKPQEQQQGYTVEYQDANGNRVN